MSGTAVRDAVAALRAAHDVLAACDVDTLTKAELLEVGDELETLGCQLPTQSHRMLARLQVETTAREMGAKSFKDVLAVRWRISTAEAGRRLALAAELGPRRALTGQPLAPLLEATAAAVAHGSINAEHVAVIRHTMAKLPGWVDPATRAQIEVDLVRLAVGMGPKELTDQARRRLFMLDQDGPEPDDTERARKRGINVGKQGRDAMSPITGELTPEARATWEAIFAKFAAPGMCNPDDDEPCVSGTPSQAQIDNDHRSLAQRQHDAFIAVGRIALMSGQLGQLNGLPVSIIIRTTLQDLESRAGIGVTGGGTLMPIADVIRLAAHANHFLAVFDKATGSAMNLFRARRVASPAQRIMLIARDGGCTKPCCTVGAYGSQVHHVVADWADDGQTNVDELGLACGCDNRSVDKDGGWSTEMNQRHEVEWIPPPDLDTGQTRINTYHRPETIVCPPDEPPQSPPDDHTDPAESATPAPDITPAPAPTDLTIFDDACASYQPPTKPPPPIDPAIFDQACASYQPPPRPAPTDAAIFEAAFGGDEPPTPDDHAPRQLTPEDPWGQDTPTEPHPDPKCVSEPLDPWADDDTATEPEPDQQCVSEPFDPRGPDTPTEPGGPSPPDGQAV